MLTLTKASGWKGKFTDLPRFNNRKVIDQQDVFVGENVKVSEPLIPIKYTVEEIKVPGYTTIITGNISDGFEITNTQVRNLEVTKDWQDAEGNALDEKYILESITVNLFEMIDGQKQPVMDDEGNQRSITIKADTDGNWKGTF
ncbi:Cna B-type domain-containing protein, partial [Granulicatella balaenopterae]